jgi:hypothetical protein
MTAVLTVQGPIKILMGYTDRAPIIEQVWQKAGFGWVQIVQDPIENLHFILSKISTVPVTELVILGQYCFSSLPCHFKKGKPHICFPKLAISSCMHPYMEALHLFKYIGLQKTCWHFLFFLTLLSRIGLRKVIWVKRSY